MRKFHFTLYFKTLKNRKKSVFTRYLLNHIETTKFENKIICYVFYTILFHLTRFIIFIDKKILINKLSNSYFSMQKNIKNIYFLPFSGPWVANR